MEKMLGQRLNSLLSGSHVSFRKMERPGYSDTEIEIDFENKRKIAESIRILRRMRTRALETTDLDERQNLLTQAHDFSVKVAGIVIELAKKETPTPLEAEFQEEVAKLKEEHEDYVAGSGYSLPPQYSALNLIQATEDILVRIGEKTTSFKTPDHKLQFEELKFVLEEFLKGTNVLNDEAIEAMFSPNSKVGGILTGGAVYAEVVRKLIQAYADSSLSIDTFVIAVDKQEKKAVFERSDTDKDTVNVILVDDVINEGGTMITAFWSAGEFFPNAHIRCEKGLDRPGEWEKRRDKEFMGHLEMMFQDFADMAEEGRTEEAMRVYAEAEAYATEKGIKLQAGWYIRKEKIEAMK